MGPVLWWWRWWTGADPNRDKQLAETRLLADQQRQQIDELSSELEAKNAEIATLRDQAEEATSQAGRLRNEVDAARSEVEDLRTQLTSAQREAEQLRKRVTELEATQREAEQLRDRVTELEATQREAEQLRDRVTELEAAQREAEQLRNRVDELEAAQRDSRTPAQTAEQAPEQAPADEPPDVAAAADVLQRRIDLDDLTVVEGIGPKIAGLLRDAGIDTWRKLADADVDRLRQVLTEAGPRYRIHDPSNWPPQAALLARGQWREFRDLVADLRSRRSA